MNRLRRNGSIAASVLIFLSGAVTAVVAQTVVEPAVAVAATSGTIEGTDVGPATDVNSSGTVTTNWTDVKAAGMTFVGVEADDGANNPTPGKIYSAQVTGAWNAGLYVMPYIMGDPLKVTTGKEQFSNGWAVIKSVTAQPYATGSQYLPIALDMEYQPLVTSKYCYGLSPAAMNQWIAAFVAAAEATTSVTPIIYANPTWWQKCTGDTTEFSADPLWIASYDVASPQIPSGWPGYTFWQYTAAGTVSGISTGHADLDQMEGAPQVITTAAGSSGSVQVQTLNSLAGQPVSYAPAAALPSGVSLTPAGQLSWTSGTPIGKYPVTVTPTSTASPPVAVVPAEVPVTVRVHGTISVSAKNRRSTAGSPVKLRIGASGPDQNAGFRPAFHATGLPKGLSMNSAGVITGWPSRPGTYTTTVTATDGLGGTGKTSFTWTVRAAGDYGPRGEIKQAGGTRKCLTDLGGKTANGTPIVLWNCHGKANQKWTTVQDGTLRVLRKCLTVIGNRRSNGSRVVLETCNSRHGAQLWQAASDGQLRNPRSGKCLDVRPARAANGTHPVIEPCANSTAKPNEHWLRRPAEIASGLPGRCVKTSGSAVVLASCANVAAERWQLRPNGTVRRGAKCMRESGKAIGSRVSAGGCSGTAAKWKLIGKGPIASEIMNKASHRCVTVPARGTRLIIAACAGNPRGTWHVN